MKIDRSTLSYRALYLRHTIIYAVFAVLWLLLALADSGAVGDLSGGALIVVWVLFFAFGSLQVGLVDAVRLPVHQGYIAAVLYLGAAVWHGIAMHYEQTPEEETDA